MAVDALAYYAPRRAVAIARHGALMQALAAAVGTHSSGGEPGLFNKALGTARDIVSYAATHATGAAWRARESGANLRALAAALGGALGAPEQADGAATPRFKDRACSALAAAIRACADAERPDFQAVLLSTRGFAGGLCACVARAAAAVPARPGAAYPDDAVGTGALILVAALCRQGAVDFQTDETETTTAFLIQTHARRRITGRRLPSGSSRRRRSCPSASPTSSSRARPGTAQRGTRAAPLTGPAAAPAAPASCRCSPTSTQSACTSGTGRSARW